MVQLIGNLSRAGLGFRVIAWRPVGWFLLGAIPLSGVGAYSFISLPKDLVTRVIGVAVLAFAILKYTGILKFRPSNPLLVTGGGLIGLLSGLVGSAGPLGAAIFLSLGLAPVAYIASEATTALAMHATKTVVYGSMLTLDRDFWLLGALLGVAMIAGTWAASGFIAKGTPARFEKYVPVLLAVQGIYLIIAG